MDQTYFNTIEDVRKSGRHLSLEERGMIQALRRQGYSLRSIAAEVGCAYTTVWYELRRGTPEKRGVVAVPHSTPPSVAKKPMRIIARTQESLVRLTTMTANHSSSGWLKKYVRNIGRWIHVWDLLSCIICFNRSRYRVLRRSTTCFGAQNCQYPCSMCRRPWGVNVTANGYARTNV